jgi:hypothetical protein
MEEDSEDVLIKAPAHEAQGFLMDTMVNSKMTSKLMRMSSVSARTVFVVLMNIVEFFTWHG